MTDKNGEYEPLSEGNYFFIRLFRNKKSKYQPSFVGYRQNEDDKIINITGFPAKQLNDVITKDNEGLSFDFNVEKKHSENFNKDYFVISDLKMHNIPPRKETQQLKLTIIED